MARKEKLPNTTGALGIPEGSESIYQGYQTEFDAFGKDHPDPTAVSRGEIIPLVHKLSPALEYVFNAETTSNPAELSHLLSGFRKTLYKYPQAAEVLGESLLVQYAQSPETASQDLREYVKSNQNIVEIKNRLDTALKLRRAPEPVLMAQALFALANQDTAQDPHKNYLYRFPLVDTVKAALAQQPSLSRIINSAIHSSGTIDNSINASYSEDMGSEKISVFTENDTYDPDQAHLIKDDFDTALTQFSSEHPDPQSVTPDDIRPLIKSIVPALDFAAETPNEASKVQKSETGKLITLTLGLLVKRYPTAGEVLGDMVAQGFSVLRSRIPKIKEQVRKQDAVIAVSDQLEFIRKKNLELTDDLLARALYAAANPDLLEKPKVRRSLIARIAATLAYNPSKAMRLSELIQRVDNTENDAYTESMSSTEGPPPPEARADSQPSAEGGQDPDGGHGPAIPDTSGEGDASHVEAADQQAKENPSDSTGEAAVARKDPTEAESTDLAATESSEKGQSSEISKLLGSIIEIQKQNAESQRDNNETMKRLLVSQENLVNLMRAFFENQTNTSQQEGAGKSPEDFKRADERLTHLEQAMERVEARLDARDIPEAEGQKPGEKASEADRQEPEAQVPEIVSTKKDDEKEAVENNQAPQQQSEQPGQPEAPPQVDATAKDNEAQPGDKPDGQSQESDSQNSEGEKDGETETGERTASPVEETVDTVIKNSLLQRWGKRLGLNREKTDSESEVPPKPPTVEESLASIEKKFGKLPDKRTIALATAAVIGTTVALEHPQTREAIMAGIDRLYDGGGDVITYVGERAPEIWNNITQSEWGQWLINIRENMATWGQSGQEVGSQAPSPEQGAQEGINVWKSIKDRIHAFDTMSTEALNNYMAGLAEKYNTTVEALAASTIGSYHGVVAGGATLGAAGGIGYGGYKGLSRLFRRKGPAGSETGKGNSNAAVSIMRG